MSQDLSPKKRFRPLTYLREAKEELLKVSWPSKKDTITYSVIIVLITILMGIYFTGLDWLFTLGFNWLINLTH